MEDSSETKGVFYFVRHGITPWDFKDVKKGPLDLSLSEKGKEDIASLAGIFQKLSKDSTELPTSIFYSPLKRCCETMEILQERLSITAVEVVRNLEEVYRGDWSKLEETVIDTALSLFKVRNYTELEKTIPDTEKWHDFNNRVLEAIGFCLKYGAKCPILVTHGQVVKSFLKQKGCWSVQLKEKWVGDARPPIKVTY